MDSGLPSSRTTQAFTGARLQQAGKVVRHDTKGIWSVPVVEIGDQRLVGHATGEQLANLISASRVPSA
jgi:hypothetical protein